MSEKIKQRNSSVEVFRIIATFMVVAAHLNGWLADMPERFSNFSVFTVSQTFIAATTCICVNCFLVITGWYGLKLKFKHFWTIYSVIVFIYVPFYLISCIHSHSFSIFHFLVNFFAIGKESYYIQCYLMLMFLSPMLNQFIESKGKSIIYWTLSFWLIEIVLDWILSNKCLGFANGYGLTHFILLYFLGRTAFLYKKEINKYYKDNYCLIVIFISICCFSLLYFAGFRSEKSFSYCNPLNIIMAFSLFFIFEKRLYHNKLINWAGASCLAVYIFHCTPPVLTFLKKWDIYALNHFPYGIYLIYMLLTIIGIFIIAVLYDKIRIFILRPIGELIRKSFIQIFENKISNKWKIL